MEPNQTQSQPVQTMPSMHPKSSAKDFVLNLGAFVALYTSIVALLNLVFTIINKAYPQISQYGGYNGGSTSISFPVATLIIFFPLFVVLMGILQRSYMMQADRRASRVHTWLTYLTLFVSGLTLAGDLVTVLYYFIDGQELTTGFLLKVLMVFLIALGVFMYFISDLRGKLTVSSRRMWITLSTVFVIACVVWGFAVIGSPRTQQLLKYDAQKLSDMQALSGQVTNYYSSNHALPGTIEDLKKQSAYYNNFTDTQTKQPYEYNKTGDTTYTVCATFNKSSDESDRASGYSVPIYDGGLNPTWNHPTGHYCFPQTIPPYMIQQNVAPTPPAVPVRYY